VKKADRERLAELLAQLNDHLQGAPTTPTALRTLAENHWSGYISRDKQFFQVLHDHAHQNADTNPAFFHAFETFARDAFEGAARQAVRAYEQTIFPIPDNVRLCPAFVAATGLSVGACVEAFRAWQDFMRRVYREIANGAPYEWGWPDWHGLTEFGILHNRVMLLLHALAANGRVENGLLHVDEARFKKDARLKNLGNTSLLLARLAQHGLCNHAFTFSFFAHPQVIPVLYAYFSLPRKTPYHVQYFSYRFIEDAATQPREALFLAKTDAEPPPIRAIHYWLYDEATRHGFLPTGEEKIFCYLFKKGTKEWLLTGKGSSYHEEEFLHSTTAALSVKLAFPKTFQRAPEKVDELKQRFPAAFNTRWGWCHHCKAAYKDCPNHDASRCRKGLHFFHNPTFQEVEYLLDIFKQEHKITPPRED